MAFTTKPSAKLASSTYKMTFSMTTMSPAIAARPGISARPSLRPAHQRLAPVRANPFVGQTNDPEKVAKNKEKKEKDSMWAEPHNNNPLEKTTLSRQGITAQSKEMKDETAVNEAQEKLQEGTEGAKDAVKGAVDKAGDAIKKVTGQD
ncbi:hypothetical protein CVIRNUC_006053 [Coccomyxa viridis]|uniref:Uncharacterized protein n=1 Tax=Coccomyxa viridis TaxID=1274662 RepID=A0AAV1I6Q5_9CHLO|nr:hypothetical protein CVIRNUC_006053 [Coccomyxa viridis]